MNIIKKSKACHKVLYLMDKDYSYDQALNLVLKYFQSNREKLEKELSIYI